MQAYKCDSCNALIEGTSDEEFTLELEKYEVYIQVRQKWSEQAKTEKVEIQGGYGARLLGVMYTPHISNMNSHDIDLCLECAKSITREAIRQDTMVVIEGR